MKTARPTKPTREQVVKRVATNLFRSDLTDIYNPIFKRKARQVKRRLKTTSRELARRRLENLIHKLVRFCNDDKKLSLR